MAMNRVRRKFVANFKPQVVFESLRKYQILSELAERFDIPPNQITTWKGIL